MAFISTTCNRRMSESPEGKGRLSTNLKKLMLAASLQNKLFKYNNDLDEFAGNVRGYLHAKTLDPPCQC